METTDVSRLWSHPFLKSYYMFWVKSKQMTLEQKKLSDIFFWESIKIYFPSDYGAMCQSTLPNIYEAWVLSSGTSKKLAVKHTDFNYLEL